jgi:hypothetical protein
MAIKTTIQGLITSLIRTNPALIDKTEHADVEDVLLANSYGSTVLEAYSNISDTTPNTTIVSTDLWYRLQFLKQGRNVNVTGFLYNKKTEIYSGSWLAIDVSEYTQSTEQVYINGITSTGIAVKLRLSNDILVLDGAIGANGYVYVNFNYFTKD